MFPKPRTPRHPAYLKWLRTKECAWCGKPGPSEAAHMGGGGRGIKGSDALAIPLCGPRGCHAYSHRHGVLPPVTDRVWYGLDDIAKMATKTGAGMRAWALTVSSRMFMEFTADGPAKRPTASRSSGGE